MEQDHPVPGTSRWHTPPTNPWLPTLPYFGSLPSFQFHCPCFVGGLAGFQLGRSFYTHTFTYNSFVEKLRHHLSTLGLDPKNYAGHSFRSGGASFAYLSGVSIEMIKALGDWRSDTVLFYLTMPLSVRLHSANMLCKTILYHSPTPSWCSLTFNSDFFGFGPWFSTRL